MSAVEPEEVQGRSVVSDNMVWIPGGTFRMGSDRHYPEEAPVHRVSVGGFWIDPTPVTNAQFRQFVRETGHVTFAERKPDPKDYPSSPPAVCGLAGLYPASSSRRFARLVTVVDVVEGRQLAASLWSKERHSRAR